MHEGTTGRSLPIARLLVLAGILIPFLDVPLTFLFGALHADYSRVSQYMSELGEVGRPYAGLVRAWFTFVSVVLAGFGVGMARLLPRSRASTAGLALFLLWAGLGVAGSFFPCDPGCKGETFSGWMHRLIGEIATICVIPVPALIWWGVRKHPYWRGFGWIALPVQVLLVLISCALGAAYYGMTATAIAWRDRVGLLQWLLWLVYYGWIVALGIQLLRGSRSGTWNDQ